MTIKYKNVPMEFDAENFVNHVRRECKIIKQTTVATSIEEIAVVLLDMPAPMLQSWHAHSTYKNGITPLLGTFLTICNGFGLDPRDYFILSE